MPSYVKKLTRITDKVKLQRRVVLWCHNSFEQTKTYDIKTLEVYYGFSCYVYSFIKR